MQDLLKKINGNLIEINDKLDKPNFSISGGINPISQNNGVVNIFTTNQNDLVPLDISEPLKITTFNMMDNDSLRQFSFIFMAIMLFFTYVLHWQSETYFQIIFSQLLSILIIPLFTLIFIFLMWYLYLKRKVKKGEYSDYVELGTDFIKTYQSSKEINKYDFAKVRKIIIEKNIILGYTVFIYKNYGISSDSFGILYFDEAYAFKEVFDNYLLKIKNDLIEKRNLVDKEQALLG